MDYETGVASDPGDLVSKIGVFAAANGWTFSAPSGGGNVLRKDDVVVGIIGQSSQLQARGALTYNGSAAWDAQTNNSGVTLIVDIGAGPYTAYHFFTGEEDTRDYLHVVVEISASHFRHFAIGQLIKEGAYTGGVHVSGTNWNNGVTVQNMPDAGNHQVVCDANCASSTEHLWVDYDSKTDNWQIVGPANDDEEDEFAGSVRTNGITNPFTVQGFQSWNLRNHMAPMHFFANRPSGLKSPIGRVPNMRMIGLQNLTPGETIDIGGDAWMVFPIIQRTETSGSSNSSIESSGFYGYAYKLP